MGIQRLVVGLRSQFESLFGLNQKVALRKGRGRASHIPAMVELLEPRRVLSVSTLTPAKVVVPPTLTHTATSSSTLVAPTQTAAVVTPAVQTPVAIAPLVKSLFTGNGDGVSWSDPKNWSLGKQPDANTDVYVSSSNTISGPTVDTTIHTLTLSANLNLNNYRSLIVTGAVLITNNTLTLTNGGFTAASVTLTNSAALVLNGGTIQNTTVNVSAPSNFSAYTGTLNKITINGNLFVPGSTPTSTFSSVTVTNGLTLNGIAYVGMNYANALAPSPGELNFLGTQSLLGTGSIMMSSTQTQFQDPFTLLITNFYSLNGLPAASLYASSGVLTLGSGISVQGSGYIGGTGLINQGSIIANTGILKESIDLSQNQNYGTMGAANFGTLELATNLSNVGTKANITIDGTSTLQVDQIVYGGILNTVAGSLVIGNTLNSQTFTGGGTFSGLTLTGTSFAANNNTLMITNGLTVNGTLWLGGKGNSGQLNFNSFTDQTLGGNGLVLFDASSTASVIAQGSVGVLTIGSGIAIEGKTGSIATSAFALTNGTIGVINKGTIQADVPGGTFYVGNGLQNLGNIFVRNGATLTIINNLTNAGVFTVDASSTVSLLGVISGGTLTGASGSQILVFSLSTLVGVTLNGSPTLAFQGNFTLTIIGGLTVNGTTSVTSGNYNATLNFLGDQTLGGTGALLFGTNNSANQVITDTNGTLTIAPSMTVRGGNLTIQGPNVINQGAIRADNVTEPLFVGSLTNVGILKAITGGTLVTVGTVTNTGTVSVDSTSSLVNQGKITGGKLISVDGALIKGQGTFDAMSLLGVLRIADANSLTVTSGLTMLGATIWLGGHATSGQLSFVGGTLAGTGLVLFDASNSTSSISAITNTLTIAAGIAFEGKSGSFGGNGGYINYGQIKADIAGGTIGLGSQFLNYGVLKALNGGTLGIYGILTMQPIAGSTVPVLIVDVTSQLVLNTNASLLAAVGVARGQYNLSGTVNLSGGSTFQAVSADFGNVVAGFAPTTNAAIGTLISTNGNFTGTGVIYAKSFSGTVNQNGVKFYHP